MNPLLKTCPVCGGELVVTRLHCGVCDTTLEGHFATAPSGPFSQLNAEQVQFLLNFVRCEGRFTRLEEELKLSYPTLRNRLYEIIRALGYEPGRDEPIAPRLSTEDRRRILEALDQGRITWEEAQRRLKGEKETADAEKEI